MRASRPVAFAYLLACMMVSSLTANSRALASDESSRGSSSTSTDLVAIRAAVNGLDVTVRADGTLAPASTNVGTAEQFELHNIGKGFIALRSIASGRFVSARDLEPLRADARHIGAAQRFR